MAISTRLTEKLGVRHPVLLAPMDKISDARLAAAVSRAGGFGIIGGGYGDEEWLRRELTAAGEARVGVGFITWAMAKRPQLLDIALEHGPPAVMLSFGETRPHIGKIKRAGALAICQIQNLDQAKEALDSGADILVAQGAEAGGHGVARGTFTLVPAVVDAAGDRVLVVAAGGVADGRGLAAALMLGADGVLVGTRFYATQEAAGAAGAKQRIVEASGDATVRGIIFDIARKNVWPAPFNGRVLANAFSEQWRGREGDLLQRLDAEATRYAEAAARGDFDIAAVIAGEAVDMIHDIPPAGEVVQRIVEEASARLSGGANRFSVDTAFAAVAAAAQTGAA